MFIVLNDFLLAEDSFRLEDQVSFAVIDFNTKAVNIERKRDDVARDDDNNAYSLYNDYTRRDSGLDVKSERVRKPQKA